ncbi:MAG: glycosyltransferase family 2 protein, partial [Bacteroidetes bacterium]|nr:glycosyltransferase family 2 protein [Bacteroidota bacterium]
MPEIAGLVSVVIPAYNAAAFIADTLKSIQSQAYPQWEIIVVNDGSTDNTSDIIRKSGISSLQLIDQPNAGVSMARNKGLDNANGEFIVFLDADDLMEPGFLSERIDFLKQHPDTGFCGGTIQNFPGT